MDGDTSFFRSPSIPGYLKIPYSWNTRVHTYPRYLRYGVAVLAVLVSYNIKSFIERIVGPSNSPFVLFYGATLISAWYGGFGAGMISTMLSALVIDYYYIHEYNFFWENSIAGNIGLLAFIVEGAVVSSLLQGMHNTIKGVELQKLQLKSSEDRLRLVSENIKDFAILLMDQFGVIHTWSNGAERLFGYKHVEIIGHNFAKLFTPEDAEAGLPEQELATVLNTGRSEDDNWLLKSDGTRFWASGTTTIVRDDTGNIRSLLKIVRDTSERKFLEMRKDEFISIASHELKTPITTLKLFAQTLRHRTKNNNWQDANVYIDKIENQVDRINELVSDLLDVGKIQAGKISLRTATFQLEELLREVAEDLQQVNPSHAIELARIEPCTIVGDRFRLAQVLTNLINNAVRYSPEANKVLLAMEVKSNEVIVSVEDFGIGIPVEEQEKVFGRFYQVERPDSSSTKKGAGLGLGLYISSEFIKAHGGRLWVQSREGSGSTFLFKIPIKEHSHADS